MRNIEEEDLESRNIPLEEETVQDRNPFLQNSEHDELSPTRVRFFKISVSSETKLTGSTI
jgi:hypothetical protein